MALFRQHQAKRFDQGAFTCSRDACYTDANRLACMGHQCLEDGLRLFHESRNSALYQGDGTGQHSAVACKHTFDIVSSGQAITGWLVVSHA